jgi:hypothetical protein
MRIRYLAALTPTLLLCSGAAVAERLCHDREPFELSNAFQAAVDASARIAAIEIGKTRDLTDPLDLVEENFPYLRT